VTRGGFSRLGGIETPPAPAPLEGMQGGPPLSLLGPSQEVRSDTDTGQMEAAAGERHLSPELALVDPDTAAAARAHYRTGRCRRLAARSRTHRSRVAIGKLLCDE